MSVKEGARVPVKIKLLRGTYRKDRDADKMAVIPLKAIPSPPQYYEKPEKDLWFVICSTLNSIGLLQSIGVNQIVIYCDQHRIYREAEKALRIEGLFQKTENRYSTVVKKNPAIEIMATSFTIMNQISKEFGFSPLSQSRIKNVGNGGDGKEKEKGDGFNF